jgi:hypothetical protein
MIIEMIYRRESVNRLTNGSKTAVMDVIGFLCVSLGSSTVPLHYSLDIACVTQLRTRPRIPSQFPRIACGGRSFLTLVLPVSTGSLSLVTHSNPPPCMKFYFCAFKVTLGLVRSYVALAINAQTIVIVTI